MLDIIFLFLFCFFFFLSYSCSCAIFGIGLSSTAPRFVRAFFRRLLGLLLVIINSACRLESSDACLADKRSLNSLKAMVP